MICTKFIEFNKDLSNIQARLHTKYAEASWLDHINHQVLYKAVDLINYEKLQTEKALVSLKYAIGYYYQNIYNFRMQYRFPYRYKIYVAADRGTTPIAGLPPAKCN